MKTIKKKILSTYFKKIQSGEKKLELRLADFEIEIGDVLILDEIDDITKEYTGKSLSCNVSYVLKTKDCDFWPQEDIDKFGFQIIQFDLNNA